MTAREAAWSNALALRDTGDWLSSWAEHIDRTEIADHFSFLWGKDALVVDRRPVQIYEWINSLGALTQSELHALINDAKRPVEQRLAIESFVRWRDRLQQLLLRDENIPREGVAQYFSDDLRVCVLLGYRKSSTLTFNGILAFPEPDAYFDPRAALEHARTDEEMDLLRRSLFTSHKIVIHRNVLVHVDRETESDVFGPTIDTLVINEFLFKDRYLPQRIPANAAFFDEFLRPETVKVIDSEGTKFLEIGCGNGLLVSTFAKNDAKPARIFAIDISPSAVASTVRNSWEQRRFPKGERIGDRTNYIVGKYERALIPHHNDLVVCNPPYIPIPPDFDIAQIDRLTRATVGTDLLQAVVRDAPILLSGRGELVLVSSEMAEPELHAAMPAGYLARKVATRRVPFNVGPVRNQRDLLKWLQNVRGLTPKAHGYTHQVTVYSIRST